MRTAQKGAVSSIQKPASSIAAPKEHTPYDVLVGLRRSFASSYSSVAGETHVTDTHTPKVSVVMPVHNCDRYVRDSVESIRAQTLEDWELVIVDDGSRDRSWEILGEIAGLEPRIRLVRNEENEGLMRALNRGLEEARAPYVARQDGDDLSIPTRLERQVRYLDAHPDVGIVGSAYVAIDEKGQQTRVQRLPCSHTGIRWRLLFDSAFCHTSVMFRAELPSGEAVRYTSFYCEDYDLWTRIVAQCRAANLEDALVSYREHADTHTVRCDHEQTTRRTAISRRGIGCLLPGRDLGEEGVMLLCRWYYEFPDVYGQEQFALCRALLDLMRAFGSQTDIEPREWRRIRLEWCRRLLTGLPDYRVRAARQAGLLGRLWRVAPMMVAGDLCARVARRCGLVRTTG